MDWETFTTNSNNIQHSQISQLIQNQLVIVVIWQLIAVRFDTSHVPTIRMNFIIECTRTIEENGKEKEFTLALALTMDLYFAAHQPTIATVVEMYPKRSVCLWMCPVEWSPQ